MGHDFQRQRTCWDWKGCWKHFQLVCSLWYLVRICIPRSINERYINKNNILRWNKSMKVTKGGAITRTRKWNDLWSNHIKNLAQYVLKKHWFLSHTLHSMQLLFKKKLQFIPRKHSISIQINAFEPRKSNLKDHTTSFFLFILLPLVRKIKTSTTFQLRLGKDLKNYKGT